MLGLRKLFFLIFFYQITVVGYSQLEGYASVYETLKPFQKFTDEYFYNERKQIKIKKITHKIVLDSIYGYTNLDSLYIHENKLYKELTSVTSYNFHCPSQEIYNYNENGLLIDLVKYPLSAYLTKEDSIVFKNRFIKELYDFTYVSDVLSEKEKVKITKSYYNKKDVIEEVESFIYDAKTKKLKEIYRNDILKEKFFYAKNKTTINYFHFDTIDRITKTYIKENVLKNKNIVSSITYELGFKNEFYIGYILKYDTNNNIVECIKNEYSHKYPYLVFKNKYKNNVLSEVEPVSDEYKRNTIYTFYENGLLKSVEHKGVKENYEYEYFD